MIHLVPCYKLLREVILFLVAEDLFVMIPYINVQSRSYSMIVSISSPSMNIFNQFKNETNCCGV